MSVFLCEREGAEVFEWEKEKGRDSESYVDWTVDGSKERERDMELLVVRLQ